MKSKSGKSYISDFGILTPSTPVSDAWLAATGPVPIRMTNDYLFRALLQRSNTALKGLICSLLRLNEEEVTSVAIMNPIELGKTFDSKDFFLDAKVSLDDQSIVHLEMQVINRHNWPERSLSYLCRTFDGLATGEDYLQVKPVIQIGLLDYTLFPGYPEFYATYELRNRKSHHLYSDKLRLCVLDLSRTDLATREDRLHKIDYWASLFKSTTWEEIKMLAKDNDSINDAAATVYQLTQEETIRLQCEAREDYYRSQRDFELVLDRWKTAATELSAEKETLIAEKDALVTKNETLAAENKTLFSEKRALVAEKEKLLALIAEHGIQLK